MRRVVVWGLGAVIIVWLTSPSLAAQSSPDDASFLHDVVFDYRNFFSKETASWLSAGLGASLGMHVGDEAINGDQAQAWVTSNMKGGQQYGDLSAQVPLAVGWWAIGHFAGSARGADAGRDLLRAQINAASWTYALKFAADRTRPNGDPRSFPSGHASATFATATVIEEHYGWKVGLPFFAAASYTAASRVANNKHWASDVVFGAFIGAAAGRTVTLHVRKTRLSIAPVQVPGGGAIHVTALR